MEEAILHLLRDARSIAIVGLTDQPTKPSYVVANYLKACGYKIYPVNPRCKEILGEKCYACLADLPEAVDIVDIFRRSSAVSPIVEDAIATKAKAVWMQLGIANEEAAEQARCAGLRVVMNRCIKIEHSLAKAEGLL